MKFKRLAKKLHLRKKLRTSRSRQVLLGLTKNLKKKTKLRTTAPKFLTRENPNFMSM